MSRAALVTSHQDQDEVRVVVDGVISANEYGPGNAYAYTGGGAGFGGDLGPATLYVNSDPARLYLGFSNLGVVGNDDQYLIYLHTRPGGLQPDGIEMDDAGDAGRQNASILSSLGTETVTYDDGSAEDPDVALVINNRTTGSGGFSALFGLKPAGESHSLVDHSSAGLGTTSVEFSIPRTALGLTNGLVVELVALEISATGFLSNEGLPDPGLPGNPGFNNGGSITFSNFHRFVPGPMTQDCFTQRVAGLSLTLPSEPPASEVFSYTTSNAFGTLTFPGPMAIATPPGETNRIFVAERSGIVSVITNLASPSRTVFLDISSKVNDGGEGGILGIAFHPGYATNRYFFLFYTATGSGFSNRIARFQTSAVEPNSAPASSEVAFIGQFDQASNHNGGDIHFGPDGYLYIATGDEGSFNDNLNNSQQIDKDFFSSILRIDVDKKPGSMAPNHHPAIVAPTNYAIPPDNPFIGATQFNGIAVNTNNVRTEFYAVGLRNPFRMGFDQLTGDLYCGDVGQDAREEVNLITKGGNYGWKWREGTIATPGVVGPPPAGFTNAIDPLFEYVHSAVSHSVIGGRVYRGSRFPELVGKYFFGDIDTGNIWATDHDGTTATNAAILFVDSGIVAYGEDPRNGDLLLVDLFAGRISRLERAAPPLSNDFPTVLSDVGVFSDPVQLTPFAGVQPYDINVSFWSDNAIKSRFFALPNTTDAIGFDAELPWTFPTGTVWVKHFELELTNGVASSAKRLETRILVKNGSDDGGYGVTYRWGDSMTDATLVPDDGLDEEFVIHDGGTIRTQVWHYPSRAECIQCHRKNAGFALGFNTPQLNRNFGFGCYMENQIKAYSDEGLFSNAVASVNTLRALAPHDDTDVSLEYRVRSYLQANCGNCHLPGEVIQANWDANIFTSLSDTEIVNGDLVNNLGDGSNRVVVPGDTTHSVLLSRIISNGMIRMPPVGSNLIDTQGVALVTAWIGELTGYVSFEDYQVLHFGSTNAPGAGANEDFDMDGANTRLEWLTGGDPTNTVQPDAYHVDIATTDGKADILFDRLANVGYEVEVSTNLLVNEWWLLDTPDNAPYFSATSLMDIVQDPDTNDIRRFYRMRLYEP